MLKKILFTIITIVLLAILVVLVITNPSLVTRSISYLSSEQNIEDGNKSDMRGADIVFVGDIMLDRHIRTMGERYGSDFIFSCIDPVLMDSQTVIGNLEGPITTNPSVSVGTVVGSANNYRFTFPTTTAELLRRHNVKIVSLGNNHIDNYGHDGIVSTRDYLAGAGVAYFGGLRGDSPVYRTVVNDIPLSFVNYNQFGGDKYTKVAEIIAGERDRGRKVIVYAHWGDEYVEATTQTRDIAELFVQNGASLIVGSHPHVIQMHEMIGNTPVYYSLGNFIFDQYWTTNVSEGLILLAHVSNKGITIDTMRVNLNKDGRTCPNEQE